MPVRRYRKRAVKRARKMWGRKRTWKKNSRKFSRADGYHKEKVTYTQPFKTYLVDGTLAQFYVLWNHSMSL